MNKNNKFRLFKHQVLITGIAVFALVVSMIGGSYAIFSDSKGASEYNSIQIGDLEISYVDNGDGYGDILSLNGAYPMSNAEGAQVSPYRFSIENTGTIKANFKLKLVNDESIIQSDGCSNNLLDPQYIMYKLDNQQPKQLSSVASSGYVILEGSNVEGGEDDAGNTINSGSMQIHELRIWIKDDAPNSVLGKHFHGKVVVESVQAGVDSKLTTTYEVGTSVTLVDDSEWYVLKQSSSNESTVRLIAKTNVSNMAFDTENLRTTSSFCNEDSHGCNAYQKNGSTVIADSSIKAYIDGTYLPALKTSLTNASGTTESLSASLPTMEELAIADGQEFNQTQITFSNSTTKAFLVSSTYWTSTAAKTKSSDVWYVSSSGTNSNVSYANSTDIGLRPAITVSKLNIK